MPLSATAQSIAVGTNRGSVRLLDLASGNETRGGKPIGGEVQSLEFSPIGEVLAVAGRGGVVFVWDLQAVRLKVE